MEFVLCERRVRLRAWCVLFCSLWQKSEEHALPGDEKDRRQSCWLAVDGSLLTSSAFPSYDNYVELNVRPPHTHRDGQVVLLVGCVFVMDAECE
eukprot:scaffold73687_cov36-Attheya_sp.AAC.2